MQWILAGVLAVVVLPATHPALAACISTKCQDAAAIERAREMIQDTCGCTRSGQTHGTYKKCVQSTLKLANLTALIPQKQCRKLIKKCENASICGKLNAAVCCVVKKNTKVKASIVASPAKCKKGTPCGADLGFYSTFDACAADGTCAGPTTTTTITPPSTTAPPTTSTSSTTTTTSATTSTTTASTTTASKSTSTTSTTTTAAPTTTTTSTMGPPITYTLNDYPALENDHHLSGHITTDGTTGVWTTNHITSWEFAITDSLGIVIVDVHSTDPGATIQSFTPTILASPSSLAVVSGPTGGGFALAQNPTGNANRVGYLPSSDPQRFFGNAGGGAIIWNSEIPTGDTFVIASAG